VCDVRLASSAVLMLECRPRCIISWPFQRVTVTFALHALSSKWDRENVHGFITGQSTGYVRTYIYRKQQQKTGTIRGLPGRIAPIYSTYCFTTRRRTWRSTWHVKFDCAPVGRSCEEKSAGALRPGKWRSCGVSDYVRRSESSQSQKKHPIEARISCCCDVVRVYYY
jgi:hypothetical protein